MALNPVAYTENVVRSFLRYQLTAYPFADTGLHRHMLELLSLDRTRRSPLLKGYVSLSRPFRDGASVSSLVDESLLHGHLWAREATVWKLRRTTAGSFWMRPTDRSDSGHVRYPGQ